MSDTIKARIYQQRITARISGARVTINSGGLSDLAYTHVQSVASTTWDVHHNLGKIPSVTIIDSAGTEWQTEIRNIDTNNLQIRFNNAMSGSAYCN